MLADYKRSRLVPETSQYTLEQLDGVFSENTLTIVKVGWAQVWWLVSGANPYGKGSGRWVWEDYPKLVPQTHSDVHGNFEQAMDERHGDGSGSQAMRTISHSKLLDHRTCV